MPVLAAFFFLDFCLCTARSVQKRSNPAIDFRQLYDHFEGVPFDIYQQ